MSLFDFLDQILDDISNGTGHADPPGHDLPGDPASASGGQQAIDEIALVNPGAAGTLSFTNAVLHDASVVANGSPDDPHVAETIDKMKARSSWLNTMLEGQNIADSIRQDVSRSQQELLDSNAAHEAIRDSNAAEIHADAVATSGERLIDSVKGLLGLRS
jgi:hypothetical protein